MKIKIKVMMLREGVIFPIIRENGDWIDLHAGECVKIKSMLAAKAEGKSLRVNDAITYIPLGLAIELPKGFEAIVAPRSSTPKNFGIVCPNSFGIIDNSYNGENDEWRFPAIGLKHTTINVNDRICQFRIQPSQKATFFQKLKWALSSGVKLESVKHLNNKNRGGFGSTN